MSLCVLVIDRVELVLAILAVALVIRLGKIRSVKVLSKSHQNHASCVVVADDFAGKREIGDILVFWKVNHDMLSDLRHY